ncbi:Uncharacterized protein Y057_7557 [Fusarium fujikuroi]|nr:Uncharacterized protein Y057_7557 [Fusarium fujikuroi]
MPCSRRQNRRDRRPDYQRHRPQRQDNVRETENQGSVAISDHVSCPQLPQTVSGHQTNKRTHLQASYGCELREYTTDQGPILELANLNPNMSQNRFYSPTPRGGVWGVSEEEADILFHFRQMKMRRPGREIIHQFTYRDDEAVSKAKQDGCPVRITANNGRRPEDDVDRGLARDMVEHSASPPEEHAIRMGRSSRPVTQRPAFSAPQASQPPHRQQHLQPHTPLRQVKKEEPE